MNSLKEQGLGNDTACPPVCVTPNPLAFPFTGEFQPILTERNAVKAIRLPHILWASMANYRTELFFRQNSIVVHWRWSHQLSRQQTFITKHTTACSLFHQRRQGGTQTIHEVTTRRKKVEGTVVNKRWKQESWINWVGEKEGKGDQEGDIQVPL